jgi:alpha-glucosidase
MTGRRRHRLPDLYPIDTTWPSAAIRETIDAVMRAGTPTAFELSYDDVQRYGSTAADRMRARAAVLLVLALPGGLHFHEAHQWGLLANPDETPSARQFRLDQPAQEGASLTNLCRLALRIRRNHTSPVMQWLSSPPDVLSFRRTAATIGTDFVCTLNTGSVVTTMPRVGSPILASSYYGLSNHQLLLPPDTVVWSARRHAS